MWNFFFLKTTSNLEEETKRSCIGGVVKGMGSCHPKYLYLLLEHVRLFIHEIASFVEIFAFHEVTNESLFFFFFLFIFNSCLATPFVRFFALNFA